MQRTQPLFISLDEHARLLGRPIATVRNQAAAGVWPVPTIRMGGRRMVPLSAHENYVRELMAQIEQKPHQSQPLQEAHKPETVKSKRGRPRMAADQRGRRP